MLWAIRTIVGNFPTSINVQTLYNFSKVFASCHLFSSLSALARARSYLPGNRFNVGALGGHSLMAATELKIIDIAIGLP